MQNPGQTPDPDVNSYITDIDPGASRTPDQDDDENEGTDIEGQSGDRDVIPVPPDAPKQHPIEAPPRDDGAPVGDVDDSPKRIANTGV